MSMNKSIIIFCVVINQLNQEIMRSPVIVKFLQ